MAHVNCNWTYDSVHTSARLEGWNLEGAPAKALTLRMGKWSVQLRGASRSKSGPGNVSNFIVTSTSQFMIMSTFTNAIWALVLP